MPKYEDISQNYTTKMSQLVSFGVQVGWRNQYCGLEYLNYEDIPVYFIDNEYYFKRPGCYGYFDDGERFAYFCRAVMESVKYMDDFEPDILHCNDWHTGVIPIFLRDVYYDRPEFARTHAVYTIHNLKYQGVFSPGVLGEILGLNMGYYTEEKMKFREGISFMKAGIVYADKVTTVSETYAEEIQRPFAGEGLDGVLREKSWKLCGITNGIDYDTNNPAKDTKLVKNYSSRSLGNKVENKLALQKELGLPVEPEVPVIAIITRLVRQKGIDLITCIMEDLLKMDIQFVLLGSGDADYQDFFEYYSSAYPSKVAAKIGFDAAVASRIYAGADMFLMPSLFEPCGISQMVSMRYGTIPIVRETGGLKDTVTAYNEFTGKGNGFSFANYNAHEMLDIIRYAVEQYKNKEAWRRLQQNAMKSKNDWAASAQKYLDLYNEIADK